AETGQGIDGDRGGAGAGDGVAGGRPKGLAKALRQLVRTVAGDVDQLQRTHHLPVEVDQPVERHLQGLVGPDRVRRRRGTGRRGRDLTRNVRKESVLRLARVAARDQRLLLAPQRRDAGGRVRLDAAV